MRKYALTTFLSLAFHGLLLGQAEMSAPALRAGAEEIQLTARFSNFSKGESYRLGVGTSSAQLQNTKIELLKGETILTNKLVNFQQGYTKSWFEVDKILVQGFVFASDEGPAQSEELTLRVTLPRDEADKQKRLFLILAKEYGPDVWYVQEGAEVDDSLW